MYQPTRESFSGASAIMSEGSWYPKTWEEWVAGTVWGVLILGFGLEFCAKLVSGDYGHALVALFFLGVVSAMLLHGNQARTWALSLSPNWVFAAAIVALQLVLFLPFIEEKRWPFAMWFAPSSTPTADEIATAVVRALPTAPAPSAPNFPAPTPKPAKNYFPAEKVEIGNLLSEMSGKLNNEGMVIAARAHGHGDNVPQSKNQLTELMPQVNQTRDLTVELFKAIDSAVSGHSQYREELEPVVRPFYGGSAFSRLQEALNDLYRELERFNRRFDALSDEDRNWIAFDMIQKYAQAAESASNDFRNWITQSNSHINDKRELLK